jgi:hypothetical protein
MPKVRPNGAARWATRTAQATADYQQGVAAPRRSWQQATVAASEAHKAALMESFSRGAFQKGVAAAGDNKWSTAAQGKGAERFGPGAQAGVGDYEKGVAKYLSVIENTQLPPRGPKGDPRNIERVKVMAQALRKAKTGFASIALCLLVAPALLLGVTGLALQQTGALRPQTPGTQTERLYQRATAQSDAYVAGQAGVRTAVNPVH